MSLRRWEEQGLFPRRFKLNAESGKFGATGHYYFEVLEWIKERLASRDHEGGA